MSKLQQTRKWWVVSAIITITLPASYYLGYFSDPTVLRYSSVIQDPITIQYTPVIQDTPTIEETTTIEDAAPIWDSVTPSDAGAIIEIPTPDVPAITTTSDISIDSVNTIPGDDEEYVAVCMTAKNESLNLPESFTHYYHHVGIRRFYIMDDGSDPPLSTYDYPIPHEAITFTYYSPEQHHIHDNQGFLNDECHQLFGSKHTWMAHFDVDEYLEIIKRSETLVSILKEIAQDPHIGALGVNWKNHNSNGMLVRQPSIRKAYTSCLVDTPNSIGNPSSNQHVKSIVRTAVYEAPANPHVFYTLNDTITAGEDGNQINAENPYPFRLPITRNRLSLHHYMIKSRQEYEEKMLRSAHIEAGKTSWDFFDATDAEVRMDCSEMAAYNP